MLLTISGRDSPGLAGELFGAVAEVATEITDIGQITIRGHLVLCLEVRLRDGATTVELEAAVGASGLERDGAVSVEISRSTERAAPQGRRLLVTLVSRVI